MASTSSQLSSGGLSSSSSSKDPQSSLDKIKPKISASKVQCDLCKLSYSTEKELTEHLLSLMHHTKLEDKETNPVHECILCRRAFSCMTDYREHIGTNQHKNNLNKHRGIEEKPPEVKKKKNKSNGKQERWQRTDNWSGKQFISPRWSNNEGPWPWQTHNFSQPKNFNNFPYDNQGWAHQGSGGCYKFYNRHNFDTPGHMGNVEGNRGGQKWPQDSHPEWGSAAIDFRAPSPRSAPFGHYKNHSHTLDFTEDSFDYNCDELWLQKREQLLADMEQDYPPTSCTYDKKKQFPNKQKALLPLPSERYDMQKSMQFDFSNKDRKRHREDDVQESLPKTVKQYGVEIGPKQLHDRCFRWKSLQNTDQPSKEKVAPVALNQDAIKASDVTKSCHTPTIDNASDNLLERAERLCKELREKRESSHAMRSSLLRAKTNHNLSDKISALTKRQQSYFKGHIKDMPLKSQSDQSTADPKQSFSSYKYSPSEKSISPLHYSKESIRTYSDGKKSAETDGTEENSSSSVKQKSVNPEKGMPNPGEKNRQKASTGTEQRRKSFTREDARDVNSSPGVEAAGVQRRRPSKNGLTKDNLLKMVNSPKSRTERVQLARMLKTRGDSKAAPLTAAPRTKVNLEGLYDEGETTEDIHLDLGPGTESQVIKLEDLSENVRSQIMNIIGEDMARNDVLYDPLADNMPLVDSDRSSYERSASNCKNARHSEDFVGNKSRSFGSGSALYDKSVSGDKNISDSTGDKTRHRKKSTSIDLTDQVKLDQAKKFSEKDMPSSRFIKDKCGLGDKGKNSNGEKNVNVSSERDGIVGGHKTTSFGERDADTSLTLNKENIMDRFPTIMNATNSKETSAGEGGIIDSSLRDSGISLCSSASHSIPLQQAFERPSSLPAAPTVSNTTASGDCLFDSPIPHSIDDRSSLTGIGTKSPSQEDKTDQSLQLNSKSKNLFDEESSISSSHAQDDNSSQTMSELLLLSEREEEVKQEMMSMELRLTRLHRLLEQAVCQINKCTERRNELHKEEKDLTSQRMNLLRAVSSRQSSKTSLTDIHNTSMCSSSSRDIQNTAPQSAPSSGVVDLNPKVPDSTQDNTSDPEAGHKSSLSKSEWLAKFSAYLPSNTSPSTASSPQTAGSSTIVTRANYIASFTIPNTIQSQTLSTGMTVPVFSQNFSQEKRHHPSEDATDQTASKLNTGANVFKDKDVTLSHLPNSETASIGDTSLLSKSSTKSNLILFGLPGENMSLRNSSSALERDRPVSPVMMPYNGNLATSAVRESYNKGISNSEDKWPKRHDDVEFQPEPIRDVGTIRPPASRKQDCSVLSPRNEDSDIGSVASLASGSSLGEKISHYCKQTPGASLEVPSRHDLSVIWSGPSDSNDLKGVEDQDSNNDSTCVDKGKSLYGNLCKEAVKSAEALHLMERNSDGLAGLSTPASEVKKKKRKTKHERNTGATRRRRGYLLSSSSEDEETLNDPVQDDNLLVIGSRQRRPLDSTSGNSSSSDVVEIKPNSDQSSQLMKDTNSKKADDLDVTIAECDSSTYPGMVDTASINAQSNKLKEMNENFIRTFGHVPTFKGARSRTIPVQEMADVCDTSEGRKSRSSRGIVISSDSDKEEVVNLCSDSDEKESCERDGKRNGLFLVAKERSLSEKSLLHSKFPSHFGSVCYLKVIRDMLYVGYQHSGFEVYDLVKEIHLKDKCMHLLDVQCMEAFEADGHVQVVVGQGCSVCSIDVETKSSIVADMGTEVSCVHKIGQSIHVGLNTGEICVLDGKLSKLNRYICSDAPVFSMASGQEGSTRLLCVASLDSTITVLDADRCLPLRILLGHSKTAFSLEVHGRFVYSGSGDSTVIVHNLHTAAVEKIHKDNKGIINCVCYNEGYLFTGGMDRLVRCYNAKTHRFVQVYYGADMGAIKSICVHGKKLITGNTSGSVDIVILDLKAKNVCPKKECGLNFGIKDQLAWHLQNAHQ